MNDVKQYLFMLRRWAWVIILGAVLGGAAGYLFSLYQPTVYETSTKIMVSRATDPGSQGYYFYNDLQLAKTYAELINTGLILDQLNDRLGFRVSKEQIEVKQVEESLLLEIAIRDGDPQRAAVIANTLVDVFIDYNADMQDKRFAESEQSLTDQIKEVEQDIANYQGQLESMSVSTLEEEKQQVSARIREIESQLSGAEDQIIQIEKELVQFFPPPLVTNTPVPYYYTPTSTPAPVPTPTLSAAAEVRYKEMQLRLDQLKGLRDLYKEVYANLLVTDTNGNSGNPALTQQQLQTTLTLYQQIYSNLLSNLANVQLEKARSAPNITPVELAGVPIAPVQPRPVQNILLGSLTGLILFGAAVYTIEFLDDTLKTPEDVTEHLRLPVIGLIGEMPRRGRGSGKALGVFVTEDPLSPIAEAFRSLRTNLDFAAVDRPIKTLLITSTGPSEGKSTVAVNLAAILAQGERKVILIDADLRRPTIHRYLALPNRTGLTDIFRDLNKLGNIITAWGDPPMGVITSGVLPPNPTELLESEKMTRILNELKENVDIIIADSPPTIVADPVALSAKVDGVLLVIEPGKTKIGAAQVMMEQLSRAGARVVGVVLNPISRRRSPYYSKYRYYTQHYQKRGHSQFFGENGSKSREARSNGADSKSTENDESVRTEKS